MENRLKWNFTAKKDVEPFNKSFYLSPLKLAKKLLFIIVFLLISHIVSRLLGHFNPNTDSGYERFANLYYFYFDLGGEANFPAFFSAFLLTIASFLLYIIYKLSKNGKLFWLSLSGIFFYLALDEALKIHEAMGDILERNLENVPDFLSWSWVIPYSFLAIFVGLIFLKFTLQLPPKTRNLFFIAGFTYVFAALFLEFFEAYFEKKFGASNLINKFLFMGEETLEMVGVVIFIYALLDYLAQHSKYLVIALSNKE